MSREQFVYQYLAENSASKQAESSLLQDLRLIYESASNSECDQNGEQAPVAAYCLNMSSRDQGRPSHHSEACYVRVWSVA